MSASRLYEINSVTRICSCYGQTFNKLGASKKRGKPFKLSIENVQLPEQRFLENSLVMEYELYTENFCNMPLNVNVMF